MIGLPKLLLLIITSQHQIPGTQSRSCLSKFEHRYKVNYPTDQVLFAPVSKSLFPFSFWHNWKIKGHTKLTQINVGVYFSTYITY
jgi:hypothetical protein